MNEDLFQPLKKGRLSEEIVAYIKNLIVQGRLKPSDRLPSERDLADFFCHLECLCRPYLYVLSGSSEGSGY